MLDGIYRIPTSIYFGPSVEALGYRYIVNSGARKVLLHFGRTSILRSGLHGRVLDGLHAAGLDVVELGGVQANPTLDRVREGVRLCREQGVDFVLAVGGGSVIDSAKAVAAGALHDGDVLDIVGGSVKPKQALPIGAILTVPGAGSESSPAAVVTDGERRLKLDFAAACLLPRFAVLNPQNCTGLSAFQFRCGMFDAMTHVMERYFTNTDYVDCSDRLCEGLLQTLMHYARLIGNHRDDAGAHAEIMWACKLAHDDVAGFGRKQDWSSHVIANNLGGYCDQPHGAMVMIVMLAWMKLASTRNPGKFVQFGQRLFGLDANPSAAAASIGRLEAFVAALGMPVRLSGLGVAADDEILGKVTDFCARKNPSGTIGNYVRLSAADVRTILELAR